ncbi:Autophagy-related protein [Venustampulla echinocandica]|uniref:Autophagy-related protein n=1 Tax=Venustampulla echinocandica TaxID=2656787 RepID=A0A370TBY7_9HELO|nr:Autophagy-related protein [Venustampulla echinocandica]RDL31761.1 Autophagy-related protein [Venustampulla echinocandica]
MEEDEGGVPAAGFIPRKPRYDGEDLSPTTSRELRGFYTYGVAAEVFAVCGVGSFLPVTLEQLARERGVLWSDKTTSCVAEKTGSTVARLLARASEQQNNQCVVHVLGAEITTSSFAMYTFSLAVFVQALALVSFSSVADHGNYRKKLLLGFGFTGAISSMLFLLIVPRIFFLGSVLVVIGVTCLGSSFVILNSFLPLLVANHPDVQHASSYDPEDDISSVPLEPLSPDPTPNGSIEETQHHHMNIQAPKSTKSDSSELKISTKISSKGVGIGYCAAVFVQILSILLLYLMSKTKASSTLPLRLVLFMVGLWWFIFIIPSSLWLRNRPGPPLPSSKLSNRKNKFRTILTSILFSWRSLLTTIKTALKLRQVLLFLVAWFLLSDAIATVSGTAILFARTELKMDTVHIALLSITSISSGMVGAFTWPFISRRFSIPTNQTIILCILLMEIIPLYGLLGFFPFVQSWGVGGLQKSWEIYPLGFIHGFVMGGLSSYCRSFFGALIPPGREAAFYALYAVTDKGSSAVGPAVVGVIVDRTGGIRSAFWFLAVLILLPAPIIWCINAEKGREDAIRMAELADRDSGIEEFGGRGDERGDASVVEAQGLMRDHDHD